MTIIGTKKYCVGLLEYPDGRRAAGLTERPKEILEIEKNITQIDGITLIDYREATEAEVVAHEIKMMDTNGKAIFCAATAEVYEQEFGKKPWTVLQELKQWRG